MTTMVKFFRNLIVFVIAICACSHVSTALAQVSFVSQAPKTVAAGSPFKVKFVLSNAKGTDFSYPDFNGFEKLAGPSESYFSDYQYINGKSSKSNTTTYTFVLQAQRNGTFTIPAATIKAEGKTLRTKPLKIQVSDSPGNSANAQPKADDDDDYYVKPQHAGTSVTQRDLYFTVDATKRRVYEQEPIMLTYKVHAKMGVALSNVTLKQKPDFKGFWTQEIELPRNIASSTEHEGNSLYRVATNLKYLVFPQQTGTISIPGIAFACDVLQHDDRMDPIDAFFNGGGNISVKVLRRTPDLNIEVLPLPTPRPAGFSGGVGNFRVKTQLITPIPRTNDVATLRITVSGRGNTKLIKAPAITFPKDFEHFEPKATDHTKVGANGIDGEVYFDYTFVPRNVGKYTLKPQDFIYFNPETKQYATISIPALTLDVKKGTRSNYGEGYDAKSRDFEIAPYRHINGIAHHDGTISGGVLWIGSLLNIFLFAILIASGVLALSFARKWVTLRTDVAGWRTSRAMKTATKALQLLEKKAGNGDDGNFYGQLSAILRRYFTDKLGLDAATLTTQGICDTMEQKSIDAETITQLRTILETCDYARFAPAADKSQQQGHLQKATEILTQIDPKL